jgi:hypothetical protein
MFYLTEGENGNAQGQQLNQEKDQVPSTPEFSCSGLFQQNHMFSESQMSRRK